MGFMEKLRNAFKKGKGQAKETTGRVGRDRRMEGEGAAEKVKAQAQQAGEKVKDAAKDVRDSTVGKPKGRP